MFECEFPELINIMRDIHEKYGQTHRIINTIEELAELQFALCKFLRKSENPFSYPEMDNIIEEIADCYLTIEETKRILHIKDREVLKIMNQKIKRGVF